MLEKQLVIVGAGGFGREVLAWARQARDALPVKGFLDDRPDALSRFPRDVGVIGSISHHRPEPDEVFVCAMGSVENKQRCIHLLMERGAVFGRLVHRTAVVGDQVDLGEGVILCPFAVIGSDARLGAFVTVNYHSTVAHDARVGRFSQLHCHVDLTGGVEIGERVTLGSHCSVLPGVRVGDGATVGSGAVVMSDVSPGLTVFGSPARPLVKREVVHA